MTAHNVYWPLILGGVFVLLSDVPLLVPINELNGDPWFGPDKLKHAVLTAIAAFGVLAWLRVRPRVALALLVAILLGTLGKEIAEALDWLTGTASVRDMVANLVGVCYGAVINALVMER